VPLLHETLFLLATLGFFSLESMIALVIQNIGKCAIEKQLSARKQLLQGKSKTFLICTCKLKWIFPHKMPVFISFLSLFK
jgi:hypothetical protein